MGSLRTGVIALKAAKDTAGQSALIHQACNIDTLCVHNDIKIIDGFVTHGGFKSIKKEAIRIYEKTPYNYLLLYSPILISNDIKEFKEMVTELEDYYGIYVKQLRS